MTAYAAATNLTGGRQDINTAGLYDISSVTGGAVIGGNPGSSDGLIRISHATIIATGANAGAGIARGSGTPWLTVIGFTIIDVQGDGPDAQPITIVNIGSAAATISKVESDSANFVIGGDGSGVRAGDSIDTWTIRPASGLEAGAYEAKITVTYDGGRTAAAYVYFMRKYRPTVSGDNSATVLWGSESRLHILASLSGSDDKNPPKLVSDFDFDSLISSGSFSDGYMDLFANTRRLPLGITPIIVSAPETDTSWTIPETKIGEITVIDVPKYLTGNLRDRMGADWLYRRITDNVEVAFLSKGALVEEESGVVIVRGEQTLMISARFSVNSIPTATIETVKNDPFLQSKALQSVPGKRKLSATGTVKNKVATFSFSAQEMNRLEPGYYNFNITCKPNGSDKGFTDLTLATIEVLWDGKVDPSDWTMPKTLRASIGQQYRLVTPIAKDGNLPALSVSSNKKRVATIGADGILTVKKTGQVTITVRDTAGAKLKCKVTVVRNSFSRSKPLYVKGKSGLFTSTKKLYSKGKLMAEVFVYNRTGAMIRGADGFVFELYDGETLIYTKPLGALDFKTPLKNKKYRAQKLTITAEMLPGVSTKAFDLGSKRFQAVIRGVDNNGNQAIPLLSSTKGAVQAKSIEAQPASVEDVSTTTPIE